MESFSRLPVALLLLLLAGAEAAGSCRVDPSRFARVFAFGNSLTDTGNSAILPATAAGPSTRPPYFGHPTGRASDGRLVIDFLVEKLRVPQPTPYLAGRTAADFLQGANFAVGGATALDPAFLESRGVKTFVPVSLSNETSWFQNVLQLLGASGYEERRMTASSLFYVGEIGANDYLLSLINNSPDVAASLVPHIIGAIRSALTAMIAAGARTVVVTGMLPLGCEPQLLALLRATGPGDYDPASGCLARPNELAERHNRALKRMLLKLRLAHPRRAIVYADVYRPVASAVASPARHGFGGRPLAACCGGGGGPYNFNFTAFCGTPASTTCADPSEYVSWDGIHFTEAANRLIARAMLRGVCHGASPEAWTGLSGWPDLDLLRPMEE
ncbi:hypothetical protein ACP70R_019347 [Stipagrostis hirtigluma subsp. patula]